MRYGASGSTSLARHEHRPGPVGADTAPGRRARRRPIAGDQEQDDPADRLGGEDLAVSDLAEPEPVDVDADELEPQDGQHGEADQRDQHPLGALGHRSAYRRGAGWPRWNSSGRTAGAPEAERAAAIGAASGPVARHARRVAVQDRPGSPPRDGVRRDPVPTRFLNCRHSPKVPACAARWPGERIVVWRRPSLIRRAHRGRTCEDRRCGHARTDGASTPDWWEDTDLAVAVAEVEEFAAAAGWDAPPQLFALVDTADLLAAEPRLAASLAPAARYTPIAQDPLPEGELSDALAQISWPDEVAGCVLVQEIVVLPPEARDGLSDDPGDGGRRRPPRTRTGRRRGWSPGCSGTAQAAACLLRLRGEHDDAPLRGARSRAEPARRAAADLRGLTAAQRRRRATAPRDRPSRPSAARRGAAVAQRLSAAIASSSVAPSPAAGRPARRVTASGAVVRRHQEHRRARPRAR